MNARRWHRLLFALIALTAVVVLMAGSVIASPAQQAETDFAAIDDYITTQMTDLNIPGIALGIVQQDQIVHLRGFGTADSSGRAVTGETPFYIGSISKSFTALAVMQLVEGGQIDLDAPVQTYLPWFELADKEASAAITVRHLLNHMSGISEKDGNHFWASQQDLEEAVRSLRSIRLNRPVGASYEYSNINYGIAGLIVEKVSGQSYADYVLEHIFEPLDMQHSYTSHTAALADGASNGHHYMYGYPFGSGRGMPPAHLPSGGLIVSAEDMSRYLIAHINEGRYGDVSILSPEGIAELHAPAVSTGGTDAYYGMGWNAGSLDGFQLVWHLGDTGHFRSMILLIPDQDTGFVMLANASGYQQMDRIAVMSVGVFKLLVGRDPDPIPGAPFGRGFLYWAIPVTVLLQILGIIFAWRRRQRMTGRGVLLTVILNLAVVGLLLGLSQLIPFPLVSMTVYFPEVGYGLLVITVLGIGWSVIYTAMSLRTRGSA